MIYDFGPPPTSYGQLTDIYSFIANISIKIHEALNVANVLFTFYLCIPKFSEAHNLNMSRYCANLLQKGAGESNWGSYLNLKLK